MKIISEYIKKVLYNKEDVTNHHGVAAIIKNENGDILIQKHNKFGFWTIPVGKVKPTQTVISGLKQEIKEECNVDIIKQKELISRKYKYKRNDIFVDVDLHIFEVLEYRGKIKNNEPKKHSEQIFMSLQELKSKKYISDATKLYFEYLKTKGISS